MSDYDGRRNMGYNIGICQISGAFKVMSGVVVEELSQLKGLLKDAYRVEVVNLICLLTFSDEMRNNRRMFVLVDNLTEEDFTWLVNREGYEVKFVEFIKREYLACHLFLEHINQLKHQRPLQSVFACYMNKYLCYTWQFHGYFPIVQAGCEE